MKRHLVLKKLEPKKIPTKSDLTKAIKKTCGAGQRRTI